MRGHLTTDDADCVNFGDVFGDTHQLGHTPERIALEVHIQPGYNYTLTRVGQRIAYPDDGRIEKLSLLQTYHLAGTR